MTRCNKRNEVSLKSTAYNPTGQSCIEQLALYNSMSSHIRRTLLAKSVIDARNKRYIQKLERCRCCKPTNWRTDVSERNITNNMIEALAYDTKHHPADFVRMNLQPKSCKQRQRSRSNFRHCERSKILSDQPCAAETSGIICEDGAVRKSKKLRLLRAINQSQSAQMNKRMRCIDELDSASDKTDWNYDEHDTFCCHKRLPYRPLDRREGNAMVSDSPLEAISDRSRSSSPRPDNHDCPDYSDSHDRAEDRKEDQKYAKFIYDITQEIVQGRLYTDNELREVFKRHIETNRETLNINKMAHEIYQLKVSLNVPSDPNADDEIEKLINAQKSMTICGNKPSAPQKILGDKKTHGDGESSTSDLVSRRDEIVQTEGFPQEESLLGNFTESLPLMLSRLCQGYCFSNHGTDTIRTGISVCVPGKDLGSRRFPSATRQNRKYGGSNLTASRSSLIDELPSESYGERAKLGRKEVSTIFKTLSSNRSVGKMNGYTETKAKAASRGHDVDSFVSRAKKSLTSQIRGNKNFNKSRKNFNVVVCPNYINDKQCRDIPLEDHVRNNVEPDIVRPKTTRSILQRQDVNVEEEKPKTKHKLSNSGRQVNVKKSAKKTLRSKLAKHAAKPVKESRVSIVFDELSHVGRDEMDETKSEEDEKDETVSATQRSRTPRTEERKDESIGNDEIETDASESNGYNDDSFSEVLSSDNEATNVAEDEEAGSEDGTQG